MDETEVRRRLVVPRNKPIENVYPTSPESRNENLLIRVTDIKQWFYCPRVVYFTYVMPVPKKPTAKMEFGIEEHQVLSALERRRKLSKYGLASGKRLFYVPLKSINLGLIGTLDLLIISESKYLPVDFKSTTGGIANNHRYQLAGYAILLEETYGCTVDNGCIYRIPTDDVFFVRLNKEIKDKLIMAIKDIREMLMRETMPEPPKQRGKCVDCEFLRFCADRL